MRIIKPGHLYELFELDITLDHHQFLRYVHRVGKAYPGNTGRAYQGTNLQDIYRTAIDRHLYLNNQIPHPCNERCVIRLRQNIMDLEIRAAERHGRVPLINEIIETEPFCFKCGHIGCIGECK